jgi:hypothetical protein
MALWGRNDNIVSVGIVTVNYDTREVSGDQTQFTGFSTGQVLRFGIRGDGGTYYGDAVISGITSDTVLTIASTHGLSGAAIADTDFYLSELPLYTVEDSTYSEASHGTEDKLVYGISTSTAGDFGTTGLATNYHVAHHGWVGVHTYIDMHGKLRVKSEVLVAMSGIQTGTDGILYRTNV